MASDPKMQTVPTPGSAAHAHGGESHVSAVPHEHHVHVVPMSILLTVFAALLALTAITVAVTWVDFGRTANIWIALFIAVIKSALVALYFMHLRWDSPFNGLILVAAIFFVALLIGTTVLDSKEYRINYQAPSPTSPQ
jgi:cytochrome c oxidase subunit IV